MKKLFTAFLFASMFFVGCKDNEKKTDTTLVTPVADTTRVIDTTFIEPGVAPIADNVLAKKPDKEDKQKIEKFICSYGYKKFNTRKRDWAEAPGGIKGRKPPKGTQPPPPPPPPPTPPPTTSTKVAYLNCLGKDVTGTMWNVSGLIHAGDAGLGQAEIDQILIAVRDYHYLPYDITITTDKAVFDAAPLGSKIEVIITEDWSWYGQAGGVAYVNSFFWTDGSPAFVFSTLLNYNAHNIGEAVAHEIGHTLGLHHQSDCTNGLLTNPYSYGKTMGNSYSSFPTGRWEPNGINNVCSPQNDPAMLQAAVGLKQ